MVKPEALSTENLSGLEWDLKDFAKRTETVIPKSTLVYQNTLGKNSIRFVDYKKIDIQESEEYQEELTEAKMDSITSEGKYYPIKRILYEADGVIAGEEDLLKIETLALRKGNMEEDERLIYDNLINIVVIELIEEDNETIESDNDLEMMEDEVSTATSPIPFTRTQPMGLRQDRRGNLSKPQAHYENRTKPNQSYDESIDYRPKGRPYPIEKPYKFQGQALGPRTKNRFIRSIYHRKIGFRPAPRRKSRGKIDQRKNRGKIGKIADFSPKNR